MDRLGSTRQTWRDHVEERVVQPARLVRARDEADVVAAVVEARARGHKARAVGSGFAFSDVASTTGLLVDCAAIDGVGPLEFAVRGGHDAHRYALCGAGARMAALDDALARRGLALENEAACDEITFVGGSATGSHGSGLSTGPMADTIAAVRLVDGRGRKLQVEPADGLADPDDFALSHPDWELVRDDATFHAARLGVGCLGLIVAVVLRVRPLYWLVEERFLSTWGEQRGRWRAEIEAWRHWELLVNPYGRDHGQRCLVTRRRELRADEPAKARGGSGHRNVLTQFAMTIGGAGDVLAALSRLEPDAMPAVIDRALAGLVDDAYVDVAPKVLRLGAAKQRAYSSEFAVPLELLPVALDRLCGLATDARVRDGIVHTAPIAVRFVGASDAWLAPQYGRATAMIECPFLVGTVGGHELLDRYEEALYPLGMRPHWGQRHHVTEAMARALYPGFDTFARVRDALDPDGVFDNPFTRRLGLSRAAIPPLV